MKKSEPIHNRGSSADDASLHISVPSTTPRASSVPGSRIPSPTRSKVIPKLGSRASTPQRSRSSSLSPTRNPASPNVSPIHTMRSSQDDGGSTGKNLVRYITRDMIKRLSKDDHFDQIRALNFTLSGDKKIRYIENLDDCKNLTSLNFSGNVIQKIEKIDHLTKLKDLSFANNQVSKIEGLETLTNLQSLNLAGNQIESIPLWLVKKLRNIRTLKLANNNLSSLSEVIKLRNLHDLISLTIAGNPLCELSHYRSYIIFHLRTLEQLDGQTITVNERAAASTRFAQEEIERLTRELGSTSDVLKQLQEKHNMSMEELDATNARERELAEREQRHHESREELEFELDAKDELLKKKAKELQRAQTKQYQLEQELAFYKLDAKFEPLNIPHSLSDEEEEGAGDSPYIGKSTYQRNQFALEGTVPGSQHKVGTGSMDAELARKGRLLKEAAERLEDLQRELHETQKQINDANRELSQIERDNMERTMTAEEKQKLRKRLAAKIQKVCQMKEQAEELEDQIQRDRAELSKKKFEVEKLKAKLKKTDPNSPEYAHLRTQLMDKEKEISDLGKQIKDNENKLNRLLKAIAVDTEVIKQLEEQLARGKMNQDDVLKGELEDIVAGLQDYLLNVKRKTEAQQTEFDNLLRDKDRLTKKLQAMEREKSRLVDDAEEYAQLQQQVAVLGELNELLQATQDLNESIMRGDSHVPPTNNSDQSNPMNELDPISAVQTLRSLNDSLNEMRALNEALQHEATELSMNDAELQTKLEEAEEEVTQLKKSLKNSETQGKNDKDHLGKQMETTARLQNAVSDKEAALNAVKKELERAKSANKKLGNELANQSAQFNNAIDNMMKPDDVARRIVRLQEAIKRGDRSTMTPNDEMDVVGRSLADLQKILLDLLGREAEEREAAEQRLNDLEKHMSKLKGKLLEAQREYKETMEAATNAKLETEKNKHKAALERLEDEIDGLKQSIKESQTEADKARSKAAAEVDQVKQEMDAREERAKLRDARAQKDLRDLEKELGDARRLLHSKDASTARQLQENENEIDKLHSTMKKLEDDRLNNARAAADADQAAARAKRDLMKAEDEIRALRDLLHAQELKDSVLDHAAVRRLRAGLEGKQDEVERLRRLLSGLKNDSADEINALLNEIDALRHALASQHTQIQGLVPAGSCYQFVPHPTGVEPSPGGHWVFTPGKSKRSPLKRTYAEGPAIIPTHPSYVIDGSSQPLTPGTPGMIAIGEDGVPILVPFEGYFCNVPEHHQLEDEITELKEALVRCREKRKSCRRELEESLQAAATLDDLEERKIQLDALINERESILKKLHEDEERMAREKTETAKELSNLKNELTRRLKRKNHLEGEVNELLGEMQMEQALAHHDDLSEELQEMERELNRKRTELKDSEKRLGVIKHEAIEAERKADIMSQRYEETQAKLAESEQDSMELERRARDTGVQLVRAHKELRQLQILTKNTEGQKIQLEDDCQQLARMINNKEAEYTALEQKIENMTLNLERLQSELLLAEEKQTERLATLRESEKILVERRDELNKLKDQVTLQREEVEALDRLMGKRKTESQLLQDNIEQQQNELATVLREGQADVQEKQKQIKQLKQDVEELTNQRSELEIQVFNRKDDIAKLREINDKSTEELQNKTSEITKHKSELKHVLEMLKLEHQDLESLRLQHETKLTELDKTQRHLLDERSELDRLQMETQRRTAEVERNKQMVDKYRSDVDHLTTERSSLEDTVNSLTKEKDYLADQCTHLEEKFQSTKQAVLEARMGVDKSKATLDQLEREVAQLRKEIKETSKEKSVLTKEVALLRNTSRDLKSELSSSRAEIDELQQQMQVLEEDLRASTKKRDDTLLEVTGLREDAKHRTIQVESLTHEMIRKQEELDKITREINDKSNKLDEKERELESICRGVDREQEKMDHVITQLHNDVDRLKKELADKKDNLESAIVQRDAIKREMERLGHLEENFREIETKAKNLKEQIASLEEELADAERDRSELRGQLSVARGEIDALHIEADHEKTKLNQKVKELNQEISHIQTRDAAEISSLELAAQDHCNRATRLANELNSLREEFINAKKLLRNQEEENEKQQVALERTLNNLKSELKAEVCNEEEMDDLENSKMHAVQALKDVYKDRDLRKAHTLREIQRSISPPPKAPISILRKPTIRARNPEDFSSMHTLREQLAAQQEEIASQIRRQMSRHREAWEERKRQSEGKLESLRRKVDNLDELVSNTSMNSLSRTKEYPADDSFIPRRSPTYFEERPEREY